MLTQVEVQNARARLRLGGRDEGGNVGGGGEDVRTGMARAEEQRDVYRRELPSPRSGFFSRPAQFSLTASVLAVSPDVSNRRDRDSCSRIVGRRAARPRRARCRVHCCRSSTPRSFA